MTGAGSSINKSYHISHRRYPEPFVLAKRNAGSGYEIGVGGLGLRSQLKLGDDPVECFKLRAKTARVGIR